MRHCEPVPGDRMDASRGLSAEGERQAKEMGAFLVREVGRVGIVICSPFKRGIDTAEPIAEDLGCHVASTVALEPDGPPEDAWKEIERLSGMADDVLVVGHHPSINKLVGWLIAADPGTRVAFKHGEVMYIQVDKDHSGTLMWAATVSMVERDVDEHVTDAAEAFVRAVTIPVA